MEFPINPALLIAAPMLQDYLVDKDGQPLSAGVITLYTDPSMMVLKPWYEQIGTTPPYNDYVKLPNPMILSAAGTIQDLSGNDVIPFFYPYDVEEPSPVFQSYFITVQNSNLELQFTRYNFPFVSNGGITPGTSVATNENLIVNNVFWRNISPATNTPFNPNPLMTNTITVGLTTLNYLTLAPSQHDGYTMPDIQYFKNTTDSTETISFYTFAQPAPVTTFPDNVLMNDVTPELYMNINCTAQGTETVRYIQIPLSLHIKSLSGFPSGTFTLQAMNNPGSTATFITAAIFQYLGTGAPTQPIPATQQILLGPAWNKTQINLPIPTAQGVTTGQGGDDAIYLQIGFPTGAAFQGANINIALPEFYLGAPPATNSFQTYDQVNAIASSARTGDTRTSINSFSPYGWVPANDGTIGTVSSSATSRSSNDTWPLYNLIYTKVNNTFAPVTGGRTAPGNTTTAAYADFILNKPMALTKALGRVLIGIPTLSSFSYSNTGVITVADATLYYFASPVILSNLSAPGTPFTAGTVYYVIPLSGTTFSLATTPANAYARIAITGGTNGQTGTVNFAFGGYFGESKHLQTTVEVGVHNHTGTAPTQTTGGGLQQSLNSNSSTSVIGSIPITINNSAANSPFNIIPPSTYLNVFIKL